MNFKKANRKIHYWGALACAVPIIIVIATGVLLLLKKEFDWVQPSTIKSQGKVPSISFETVLEQLQLNPETLNVSWNDIKRIDVRPSKGLMKIQLKNQIEIQMDHQTGNILKTEYRRSDVIESIHDGSYFSEFTKMWVFLPSAILLFILWITGIYLFAITELSKYRSRKKQVIKQSKSSQTSTI
jgi:uncharacterized iron-regulated membrane protein